jgi:hypothetical protein
VVASDISTAQSVSLSAADARTFSSVRSPLNSPPAVDIAVSSSRQLQVFGHRSRTTRDVAPLRDSGRWGNSLGASWSIFRLPLTTVRAAVTHSSAVVRKPRTLLFYFQRPERESACRFGAVGIRCVLVSLGAGMTSSLLFLAALVGDYCNGGSGQVIGSAPRSPRRGP